jgi:hypothetical protein
MLDGDSEYTRKMIHGFIKIQEDILKIPNDVKIKLGLVNFMNSMN